MTVNTTPSVTYLPFGHPFVKADVPAGTRLKATWTPQGNADSIAVPIQASSQVFWGDGSLKFAALGVTLPAIAGSASGMLHLAAEAGEPVVTLPNNKTAADVLADLRARFPFSVGVANLTRGRESITVNAPGSGYTSNDTVVYSGGVGGTPPAASTIWLSGTGVDAIMFTAPSTPYSTVPTVTINSATGSGAALTFVNPPIDGSGSWTWTANNQFALLGSTDATGRVRCEVIESGPLFVTFACWGPFLDNTGGASHPELVVRAWYRCWLDQTTGAIDRVEYLHSVEQGWIGDLNGGATVADQQVGDFTIMLNGLPIAGHSYPRVRVIHHTANPLTVIDGSNARWTTGGSCWTSNAPTLRTSHDLASRQYWRRSGLVPAYDLEYYDANPPSPATDPDAATYAPGSTDDSGKMTAAMKAIDKTGASTSIGLTPQWDILGWLTDDPGYRQSGIATALHAGGMPIVIRNPATGRIPVLVSKYNGGSVAQLGTSRPTTFYVNNVAGSGYSSDFKLAPRGYASANGATYQDGTNNEGAWGATGTYGPSHFPSLAYMAYLRTAAPWFLETVKVHANGILMSTGSAGGRTDVTPDGVSIEGSWLCYTSGERQEAWSWKMIVQALAVLPDDAIERPYFQRLYDDNNAAADAVRAHFAANSAGFAALGCWTFVGGRVAMPSGNLVFHGTPWMQNYLAHARAFEYLALDRPAHTLAWLTHYTKMLEGLSGGSTPARTCGSFGGGAYNLVFGWGASKYDYFPDWASTPTNMDNSYTATFDATTQSTGAILATGMAQTPGGLPLAPGDQVMFVEETGNTVNSAPPSPFVLGRNYCIASISGGRAILSPNADLSSPITSCETTAPSVGFVITINRAITQTGAAGTSFVQGEGIGAYAALNWMAVRLFCAAGVIDPNAAWVTALDNRMETMAPDWTPDPMQRVAKSL